MGISVSFSRKENISETTHVSYSTMTRILRDCELTQGVEQINKEYYVQLPAKKVVAAFEDYIRVYKELPFPSKYMHFVKQMLTQYHDMCKSGAKPVLFGGA